jgi:hypothetical protein
MTGLAAHHLALLEKTLSNDFVPHLPPLLDIRPPAHQQQRKNMSRAFSAFALQRLCDMTPTNASKAVVDDFDDFGVDAIYYHASSETVYLVQAKLKSSAEFSQDEALGFCQGVRKLIKQDFTGFNKNVQDRLTEIEDALENCRRIQLVVAHTGSGISHHAQTAVQDLLDDEDHGEERFAKPVLDYDSTRVVADLLSSSAYERVDAEVWLHKCESIHDPRLTYFGLVRLDDLVKLHQRHGKALYERNIRSYLGHKTDVNTAIRETLAERPSDFLYLNNGVAALCQEIEPKGFKGGRKKLRVRGFSVINGAQTIASATSFLSDNHSADISNARVSLTLIKAAVDSPFGKAVTRARNHQNPIFTANFVALDDEQERLRRELAHLGIRYIYKAEFVPRNVDPKSITVDEAAQALALFQPDPRFVVWVKKEPGRLLDSGGESYKALFSAALTPFEVVNAVLFSRYIQGRMTAETSAAAGPERLTYRHGSHALAWALARRISVEQRSPKLFDEGKMKSALSAPVDKLRQMLWTETQKMTATMGPLALFRNQTEVVRLLELLLINDCGLSTDPVVEQKRKQQKAQSHAQELFAYLSSKAPQIEGLS